MILGEMGHLAMVEMMCRFLTLVRLGPGNGKVTFPRPPCSAEVSLVACGGLAELLRSGVCGVVFGVMWHATAYLRHRAMPAQAVCMVAYCWFWMVPSGVISRSS